MAFKLRYTSEELREHIKNRLSYHQAQMGIEAREIKTYRELIARYERERNRSDIADHMFGLYDFGYLQSLCHAETRFFNAKMSLKRFEIIQNHLPDLQFHDLEFSDLEKLEIR